MTHCPVNSEIDAMLRAEEEREATAAQVDAKVDELMEDESEVAGAIDQIMADSDVGLDGNSLLAHMLAEFVMADAYDFEHKSLKLAHALEAHVRAQLRPDAESLVSEELAQSGKNYAESVEMAREASRNFRDED